MSAPFPFRVAVVGGGPAGLMAADVLLAAGAQVELFDAMPSVGRKFLLAGKGGLNITHAEPEAAFRGRYRERAPEVGAWLDGFGPEALRAWLHRLRAAGLALHARHRWTGQLEAAQGGGWTLGFDTPQGPRASTRDAVVLALGGASWARLGSDGAWQPWLAGQGVDVAPLVPANCGFDIAWSDFLRERHAGTPLKNVRLKFTDRTGQVFDRLGEAVLGAGGLEGNLVYAASALLRDEIAACGHADIALDLLPAKDEATLAAALARGRGARSMINHLKEQAGIHGVRAAQCGAQAQLVYTDDSAG